MSFRGTTIVAVKKDGKVCIAGDGQVTAGDTVMKGNARKVRRIYQDKIVIGFAGGTADAFTLFELFEKKLAEVSGDLTMAAISLAKEWRLDRALRKLEAMMLATDGTKVFLITGTGDVLEPEYNAVAIGSGGNYAVAAARAYLDCAKELSAKEIALKSLEIASSICIYTDTNFTCEEIG
ncbi:MAG: ATP-dependent protease subunit HslV [Spirochaetales bacterium]|nr:ATP-dependent protease subunit HslV [Spirochaetales bacterium]